MERQDELFNGLSAALGVELRPVRANVTADGRAVTPVNAEAADAGAPDTVRLMEARTAVDRIVYEHFAASRSGTTTAGSGSG